MIEELQLVNYWISKKDPAFFPKLGIDRSYFFALNDVVEWIEKFRDNHRGDLPTADLVAVEFEEFQKLADLDNIDYLVNTLKEQKAYTEYRPALERSAALLNEGKTIQSIYQIHGEADALIKKYAANRHQYDWVKQAQDRYLEYMKRHGIDGLAGISTGIPELDKLVGGWAPDDLILLAGRLNEGKSLLGAYFAFNVWMELKKSNIEQPVVLVSTEMPALEVACRLDSLKSHFSNRSIREGRLAELHESYREYLEQLSKESSGFMILSQDDRGGTPFRTSDIHAVLESEQPAFLLLDQLYDIVDRRGEWDVRRRLVNVSREIRDINLLTRTPTMILAHAGREAAKEARKNTQATPEADQIQESDAPAQKATHLLTIRKFNDTFKLSLKKNRRGEKDKDIFLRADIDHGIFEPTTEEELVF